jgi:ABC-type lipoprotein export system ATPase subunit
MNINVGSLVLAIGRRGSGKSTILRWISEVLLQSKKYDYIRVVSPTAQLNNDWDHIEGKFIISEDIEDYIEDLYEQQKITVEKNDYKKGLLILDDIAGSISFRNRDKLWAKIGSCGRHYKITTIVVTQYIHTASPLIRTQSDLIILMGRFSLPAIKSIYEQYSPINVTTEQEFKKKLEKYTKDHGGYVIDNRNGAEYYIKTPINFKATSIKQ